MVFENLQIGLDVFVVQTASVNGVVSVSGEYDAYRSIFAVEA